MERFTGILGILAVLAAAGVVLIVRRRPVSKLRFALALVGGFLAGSCCYMGLVNFYITWCLGAGPGRCL